MSLPTREQLKARSKHLSKLLQEKYNVKVSHGHCLDVVSQLFGHKDWNTASAACPEYDSTEPVAKTEEAYASWLEALTKGFDLSVEQPYQKETFHAGGAMAQRSLEQGVRSLEFTPRIDEQNRQVILTLPTMTIETANEAVTKLHKHLYLEREKHFAKKLGLRAEDLNKA